MSMTFGVCSTTLPPVAIFPSASSSTLFVLLPAGASVFPPAPKL